MVRGVMDDHLTGGLVAQSFYFAGGVCVIALIISMSVSFALIAAFVSGLLFGCIRYFRGKRLS